jgi:hypothetical protein
MEQPRVEELSVYIEPIEWLPPLADVEFVPRHLDSVLTVGLTDQSHDAAGIPVNSHMKLKAPLNWKPIHTPEST